jgi:Domain of unknown function (DUF4333)
MLRRRGILIPFFLVVVYLAGCGGGGKPDGPVTVDQGQLEQLVTNRAEAGGGTVKTVTCPDEVLAVKGDTITCDFYFEGGTAGYADVKVTSADGDISLDPKDLTFSITD